MRRALAILLGLLVLLCGCTKSLNSSEISVNPQINSCLDELLSTPQSLPTVAEPASSEISVAPTSSKLSSMVTWSEPSKDLEWWQIAFNGSRLQEEQCFMSRFLVYRDSDKVSADATGIFGPVGRRDDFSLVLNTAKKADDIGKPLEDISFFEILLNNNAKYTGTFYEKGISLSKALPGENAGDPVLLSIKDEDYQILVSSARSRLNSEWQFASWLTLMRESKCSSCAVVSHDGTNRKYYTSEKKEQIPCVFSVLQFLRIVPGSCKIVDKTTALSDAAKIHIEFINGVFYDVQSDGKTLIVASSDINSAVQYEVYKADYFNVLKSLDNLTADFPNQNPDTGKPVIYLYPEHTMDVSVKVKYKGQFSYTYPAYNNGWLVTADPDGHLVNKADGSEHYYLFWEGNCKINWKFDKGFVVKGAETEQFLLKALSTMGLTPREYNDFIVYWLPEMKDNAYNLITFATKQYEELAPLEISPSPDSVLRVHMVYKALKAPIKIAEQHLKPFERKGFTVVEWGGSRG